MGDWPIAAATCSGMPKTTPMATGHSTHAAGSRTLVPQAHLLLHLHGIDAVLVVHSTLRNHRPGCDCVRRDVVLVRS